MTNGGGREFRVGLGETVIINGDQYMLEHGVVEDVYPELGEQGFALIQFIGRSGTPLARRGRSTVNRERELPPRDLIAVQRLNPVEG